MLYLNFYTFGQHPTLLEICHLCKIYCFLFAIYFQKSTKFGQIYYSMYTRKTNYWKYKYQVFYTTKTDFFLFYFMFIVWGLYGIAALFDVYSKNLCYNILDIISKNFYGLFIFYKIIQTRKNLDKKINNNLIIN